MMPVPKLYNRYPGEKCRSQWYYYYSVFLYTYALLGKPVQVNPLMLVQPLQVWKKNIQWIFLNEYRCFPCLEFRIHRLSPKNLEHYAQDRLLAGKYVDNEEVQKYGAMGTILVSQYSVTEENYSEDSREDWSRVRGDWINKGSLSM